MGKYQRTKGLSWEREIAEDLRPIGFPNAKRHLESQFQEAKGYDLDNTGMFRIQAKCMAKVPNIPAVFKEIEEDPNKIPVVVFRVTNKGEYACFKWEDAMVLMGWRENFPHVCTHVDKPIDQPPLVG